MRTVAKVAIIALSLAGTRCTEWVPARVSGAAGERYVRVELPSETTTLRSPSRATLRDLENDGARLEVRRVDGANTALATLGITIGVAVMTALVAYAAAQSMLRWPDR